MRYAAFYGRYSCERQNEQSIEGQLRICQQYAEQNELKIVETYIDRATTGTNDNRPAFQKMLADCEKPVLWDILLVYAIDRFGRNSIEIAVNKQKLKKNKKTLISATQRTSENIDGTKNLDGILLENMYIGLAEYYSAELSQKIRRGLHENREKGLYSGGFIPFGYKVKDRKVYIDEDKAEIVRFIFRQYAAGFTVKNIVYDLNEKGLTKNGKPFALTTVYDILRLEKYVGICRYSDGIYTNIYPPILPMDLFNEVQMILAHNKKGSSSGKADFLLKGKLICGLCGANLQGESGTSKSGKIKYYYKCGKRKKFNSCKKSALPKEKFEILVINVIHRLLDDPSNIEFLAENIMNANKTRLNNQSVLNTLLREREEIQKSLSNIMKAVEQGLINDTMKKRMDELEQQLKNLEEKIALEQLNQQKRLSYENIISFLQQGILQKPKFLILTLIQKIVVFEDKINIFFNYTNENNPDDSSRQDYLLPKCSTCYGMVEINGLEPSTS